MFCEYRKDKYKKTDMEFLSETGVDLFVLSETNIIYYQQRNRKKFQPHEVILAAATDE